MRILLTGATSQIGIFLIPRLLKAGHEVFALSRDYHEDGRIHWLQCDLADADSVELPQADVLINLAGLTLIPNIFQHIVNSGVKRLIAFSSTSVFTKPASSDVGEKEMIHDLKQAEAVVNRLCEQHGVDWTLFRPTLIYSLGRDKNISLIDAKIRRFHFFPMVGSGSGLRQPVHAEDLALACMQAMDAEQTFNRAYNLSGGEVLSYREMVIRLFQKRDLPARLIPVPTALLRFVIMLLRLLPRYRYLSPNMADRMSKDMVFPHDEASRDFGFAPRPFQP